MTINTSTLNSGQIRPVSVFEAVNTNRSNTLTTYDSTADYIKLPTSGTTEISRNIMGGSEVWGVAHTDINAAADRWSGFIHFDSVGGLIWMIATDTGTTEDTHYLATLAIADGAIVQIGNFQSDNFSLSVAKFMPNSRAAESSGDFTIISLGRKFVLTSAGALSTDEVWAPTGVTGSAGNRASGILDTTGAYVISSINEAGISIDTCNGDDGGNGVLNIPPLSPLVNQNTFAMDFGMWGPNLALFKMNSSPNNASCQKYYTKASVFNYVTSMVLV